MKRYVVALDQGTTSSRAILFDRAGRVRGVAQRPLTQRYPQPGWVEHDPREIASSQLGVLTELLVATDVAPEEIAAIGIANQRETTVVWDRSTGLPVGNAIVWQCRRTTEEVERVCGAPGIARMVREKTGLVPDAYFSASKVAWILDHVPGARTAAERGELAFGTVDSWLVWNLTHGAVHATDVTNASRTMLYDIHEGRWDEELLDLFGIPAALLPEVRPSSCVYGLTARPGVPEGIPVAGVAGDQQAALFGQCCFSPGSVKSTYGTGCFLLMHTGTEAVASEHGLVTTVAASAPGAPRTEYALEGSVFVAGALLQWLRDELGVLEDVADSDRLARSVEDSGGVVVVPAFTGLGAPWWDAEARGAIFGLTRGTTRAHLVRAALESLAFQVADVARTMERDAGLEITSLDVDGGACANDFLMQFQADVLHARIDRPTVTESTGLGAAFLAGLAVGFWDSTDELKALRACERRFEPAMPEGRREACLARWHRAVERTKTS